MYPHHDLTLGTPARLLTAAAQRSTSYESTFSASAPNTFEVQLCGAKTPSVTPNSGTASTGLSEATAIPASKCIHGEVHVARTIFLECHGANALD